MTALIDDLLRQSRKRLADAAPESLDAIRGSASGLIGFSPAMAEELAQLKAFLFAHMYRHPRVTESDGMRPSGS